jgi:hypothetical protein
MNLIFQLYSDKTQILILDPVLKEAGGCPAGFERLNLDFL